jgi:hypothetical protein
MAFDDHCKGRFEIAIARGGDHNEFLTCSPCSVLHVAQFLRCIRAVRIGDDGNNADIGNKLARKLKPLPTKPRANQGDARHVAFGLVQSRHEAGLDWIEGCNKHNGNRGGGSLSCECRDGPGRRDQTYVPTHQIGR